MINNRKNKGLNETKALVASFVKALIIVMILSGIGYGSYVLVAQSQRKTVNVERDAKGLDKTLDLKGINDLSGKANSSADELSKVFSNIGGSLKGGK